MSRTPRFEVVTHRVDVSNAESVAGVARAADALGRVKSVVHTAGLSLAQASADAILHVDLLGVAHTLDEFGKVIAKGGAGIVIASMAGTFMAGKLPPEVELALERTPTEELLDLPILKAPQFQDPGAAYSLAKRANQLRVQAASLAWGHREARLNSISPGIISTAMGREELEGESGGAMRAMVAASSIGRTGTSSEITAAAAFLLGAESSFVTGTDLLVDGGVVAAVRSGVLKAGRE